MRHLQIAGSVGIAVVSFVSGAFLAFLETSAPPPPGCSWFCAGIPSDGVAFLGATAFGGLVGIGVGAVVDAFRRERRVVYERPSNASPSVSIVPLVTRCTAGMAIRLRPY